VWLVCGFIWILWHRGESREDHFDTLRKVVGCQPLISALARPQAEREQRSRLSLRGLGGPPHVIGQVAAQV
jgi:hypothetical protein